MLFVTITKAFEIVRYAQDGICLDIMGPAMVDKEGNIYNDQYKFEIPAPEKFDFVTFMCLLPTNKALIGESELLHIINRASSLCNGCKGSDIALNGRQREKCIRDHLARCHKGVN